MGLFSFSFTTTQTYILINMVEEEIKILEDLLKYLEIDKNTTQEDYDLVFKKLVFTKQIYSQLQKKIS